MTAPSCTVARRGIGDQPAPTGTDVRVDGLDVRYGDQQVLDGATLHVRAGTVLALLGPSGCGTTTLLRSIAGAGGAGGRSDHPRRTRGVRPRRRRPTRAPPRRDGVPGLGAVPAPERHAQRRVRPVTRRPARG
ncbi:MAG: ATP-binding cassette domain-containing protein [Actinobacteria bacterium]|nr:ATP-binding cassette domain-containing protein [Actinomycetota bacterium]